MKRVSQIVCECIVNINTEQERNNVIYPDSNFGNSPNKLLIFHRRFISQTSQ